MVAGSAIWGLFWLPLRYLHESGIAGMWAVALVMGAALIPALAVLYWQREQGQLRRADPWLLGIALGSATVLYFTGILFSDVIRVIFLFYLLPLWTTLSARLIYGEPIRRDKLIVIVGALVGVWLLLGGGSGLPLPRNVGDWCGIGAGMCWGISLSLLRGREASIHPTASTATALFAALLLASLAGLLIPQSLMSDPALVAAPNGTHDSATLLLGCLFGGIVLFPAMFGQIWGARRIPAPTAALLTMSEILVATLSAWLLVGTDLEPLSWLGGAIIVGAVCIDLYIQRNQTVPELAVNQPADAGG